MLVTGEDYILTGLSIIFSPLFSILFIVIVLAAAGKTTGITKLYTRILLLVFEWGKHRINIYKSHGLNETSYIISNLTEPHTIDRDLIRSADDFKIETVESSSFSESVKCFIDVMSFCKNGIQSIIEDTVTQRFDAAELPSWNLLTRTNTNYEFISWRLTILWGIGCILRLIILFPIRILVFVFAFMLLTFGTAIIGLLPDGSIKRMCNYRLSVTCYRILTRSFSAIITFHNRENRARVGGICVANHTSPIDIIILGYDNCFAMVGQSQGGLFGFLQRAMSRSEHHIWFERSQLKDRMAVTQRLKEHVEDSNKLPILIFPEGTCINNTSIMMFKKGSFEVGGTIYPVAIKYDSRFADPFWNSNQQSLTRHLINILTSWALVVDVWYLPPEHKLQNESVIEFTNRVKASIAKQGGLVDLEWDGSLKREKPKTVFLENKQREYSQLLTKKNE